MSDIPSNEFREFITKEDVENCQYLLKKLQSVLNPTQKKTLEKCEQILCADFDSEEMADGSYESSTKSYLPHSSEIATFRSLSIKRGSYLNGEIIKNGSMVPVRLIAYLKILQIQFHSIFNKHSSSNNCEKFDKYLSRRPKLMGCISKLFSAKAKMPYTMGNNATRLSIQLSDIGSWDAFDIFLIYDYSDGHPLEFVFMTLIKRFGLIQSLDLNETTLINFIQIIEKSYHSNPYHNHIHAADVLQSLGSILITDNLYSKMTNLELLALVIAAAAHDVEHLGVTNVFHMKTRSKLALLYNDRSVNENLHASKCFENMQKPENNVLKSLKDEDYMFVRNIIISTILKTDMIVHDDLLSDFSKHFPRNEIDINTLKDKDRIILHQMLVHAADISNPARPWKLCENWSYRITEENFRQGDQEIVIGIERPSINHREKVHVPESQKVFLKKCVEPVFKLLSKVAPKASNKILKFLDENYNNWDKCEKSKKVIEVTPRNIVFQE